jgi:hypothetical protein
MNYGQTGEAKIVNAFLQLFIAPAAETTPTSTVGATIIND